MSIQSSGYIKLPREIMNWRWYKNANTCRVYFHLVLSANYTDQGFDGLTVHRGQVITSRQSLAKELNLSEQEIRTALKHLKSTSDITIKTTSKYSIITIVSFDMFQGATNTSTANQPAINQLSTSYQPQYKKVIREESNKSSFITPSLSKVDDKEKNKTDDIWANSRSMLGGEK